MKYFVLIVLLGISTVFAQSGKTVHFSLHFTLETALNYDTTQLENPCATQAEIDATLNALQEWILVLQNPGDLDSDIAVLNDVRELIVAAKNSFEQVADDFNNTVNLAQIQSRSKVTLQTQIIHKVFTDEMNDILAQIQTFNEQTGDVSELSQLAENILTAIDSLIVEIQDLQALQANFTTYTPQLTTLVSNVQLIRETCYGTNPPVDPVDTGDNRVSSATLDDFVPTDNGNGEVDPFTANSAVLNSFTQTNNKKIYAPRKQKKSQQSHLSRNQRLFKRR